MKEETKQQDSGFIQTCKRCVVHVKKHRHFYSGTGIGVAIIAILITIFAPLKATSPTSAYQIGGQEEKALLIFYQIEDIASKRDLILHDIGKEHFAIREENFHRIDDAFHRENDLIAKFRLAQQLDNLIERQKGFINLNGYISTGEEQEFQQLEYKFDSLYNIPKTIVRTEKSVTFDQDALTIFDKLKKIAEKRDTILHSIGIQSFRSWEASYHEYVSRFSKADTINERYDLSKDISNLLYRQDEYFRQQGYIGTGKYITDTEEKIYQDTQDAFNQIK